MRVSTRGAFLQGLSAMQRLSSALDQTQRQISSGRRLLTPSDDPIAASRALKFRESVSRLEQFDRNAEVATNRLALEESTLESVNNALQRVRELALQASNATQNSESRQSIAVEMRERLDQLVQLANQKDGSGGYLFSGNLQGTEAVSRSGASYTYNGDQGQRQIQIGEDRQVADGDSGAEVFFAIRNGNGTFSTNTSAANTGTGVVGASSVVDVSLWVPDQYTVRFIDQTNYEVVDSSAVVIATGTFQPGDSIAFNGVEFTLDGQPEALDEFTVAPSRQQDVFTTVANLIAAVEQDLSGNAASAQQSSRINEGLLNVDQAIGNILDVRTQVGSRLAIIESQQEGNGAFKLSFQEALGSLEDLDYAEALSRLSLQASTLEAAQQSFIRTQSLSLFSFL